MDTSERERASLTRRTFLGCSAGLAAGLAVGSGTATARSSASTTVLARNTYLGVDLTRLFQARSLEDVRTIAGELLASVEPTRYEARADAIAGEIEATGADVVALQEGAMLRTQRPGDFGSEGAESASKVVVDFLSLIESALAARDLEYEVVASTVTTDVELPADTGDRAVDVRVTDRDALLVRGDLGVGETTTGTFDAALSLPVPETDRRITLQRGFCSADVVADGVGYTAVSTHLESVSERFRLQQAGELLDRLPEDRPVFVCGDFNSGPGGTEATYNRLTESLTDAYATRKPDAEGYTCCQAADLANETSQLDRRIDAILFRGDVRPAAAGRVGHEPDDRVEAGLDGATSLVWPSDHAGVVGSFEVAGSTPTPSPTATERSTPTEPAEEATEASEGSSEGGLGPGPGVLAVLAGLGGGVLARLYR